MIVGAPVCLWDYGATGDGATDDSDALQAAFDAAAVASPKLKVVGASGAKYRITKQLNIDSGVPFDGNGCEIYVDGLTDSYVFDLSNNSIIYATEAPWHDVLVNMTDCSSGSTIVFNIDHCVGKVFDCVHVDFLTQTVVQYGNNCWVIEWRSCFFKTKSSSVATTYADAVYVPSGVTNAGENMKYTSCTFAGFDIVFDVSSGFGFTLVDCSIDYCQKVLVQESACDFTMLGGWIESNWNGNWFETRANSVNSYGNIRLTNMRVLMSAPASGTIDNYFWLNNGSTIVMNLDGVYFDGMGNYTPAYLSNTPNVLAYRAIQANVLTTLPMIGGILTDRTLAHAPTNYDWGTSAYADNGGTVTFVADAGPGGTGNGVVRLATAANKHTGINYQLNASPTTGTGVGILVIKFQYKLTAGTTGAQNGINVLVVGKSANGDLLTYSAATEITNADGTWRQYTGYSLYCNKREQWTVYIEGWDNGNSKLPQFDITNFSLEFTA